METGILVYRGLVTSFAGQFFYVLVSGNASHQGDAFTSLTSDLLWYRLFPNATNSVGIFPSALIVSLPLLALTIYSLSVKTRQLSSFAFSRSIFCFACPLSGWTGGQHQDRRRIRPAQPGCIPDPINVGGWLFLLQLHDP